MAVKSDKYKLAESLHGVIDHKIWSKQNCNIHVVQIESNVKPGMSC